MNQGFEGDPGTASFTVVTEKKQPPGKKGIFLYFRSFDQIITILQRTSRNRKHVEIAIVGPAYVSLFQVYLILFLIMSWIICLFMCCNTKFNL